MIALKILVFLWLCHCVPLQGSEPKENSSVFLPSLTVSTGISKLMILTESDFPTTLYPTEEKSAALTMAASGVIIFIVILVVIVIILVSMVSIKFKCRHCKKVTATLIKETQEGSKGRCEIRVPRRATCVRVNDYNPNLDKPKPQHPIVSYSCSDADTTVGKKNVLLVSVKDLSATSNKSLVKVITHEE